MVARDFSLKGADGREYSLSDFSGAKILVMIFMCNHCPYVLAVLERLVGLAGEFSSCGVQFVGINSNIGSPGYEEEESANKMQGLIEEYGINFPYLIDDSQETAKTYQAQCTPDIYVFDEERKLAYHGRIDDNWKEPAKVSQKDLSMAIRALLKGEKPTREQRPSMGCSIKWKA
ncbi:thioredoxin family protein [Candidatus Peregrinibacteria bacterium]|nr:thioredoxin family protein [Candidatus Peregrinibacteria bacterium]